MMLLVYPALQGQAYGRCLISRIYKTPMKKSCVLPIRNLNDLFSILSRPDNSELSIKDFRLKAITLLGLFSMLRPSDIAPMPMSVKDKSRNKKIIFLLWIK